MIDIIPRLEINLAVMTRVSPTLETVVAQIILGIYLIVAGYVLILGPRKERQILALRESR